MAGREFVPVELERGNPLPRPVEWYALIREMEMFRAATGWGLARTWGYINEGNYEVARASFDSTLLDPESYEVFERYANQLEPIRQHRLGAIESAVPHRGDKKAGETS